MTFMDVLLETARNDEFVRAYDALRGTSIAKLASRSPLDTMIDHATGHEDKQLEQFIADVYDLVWCRMTR